MKKILGIILIILCAFLITGCTSSDKHIKEISFEGVKNKLANKDTFALYIGNENCSHCVEYMPTLKKVLKKYDITIYHMDNSKLSESEYSEFKTYINISGTPTIVFITDGEEETTLNRIVGTTSESETIERFKTNGYIK